MEEGSRGERKLGIISVVVREGGGEGDDAGSRCSGESHGDQGTYRFVFSFFLLCSSIFMFSYSCFVFLLLLIVFFYKLGSVYGDWKLILEGGSFGLGCLCVFVFVFFIWVFFWVCCFFIFIGYSMVLLWTTLWVYDHVFLTKLSLLIFVFWKSNSNSTFDYDLGLILLFLLKQIPKS